MSDEKIIEATSISLGVCDFCRTVHVNLLDATGEILASAGVPVEIAEAFIEGFRAQVAIIQARPHPAPARRQ
jgi:hypothetical protein